MGHFQIQFVCRILMIFEKNISSEWKQYSIIVVVVCLKRKRLCIHLIKIIIQLNSSLFIHSYSYSVQTDPAKNVLTRAYQIPERNRTVKRQEFCLFICFLHELGGNKCFINHFLLSYETFWLCHRILIEK